jgi:membrane associated rhomboid family serine protease
MSLLSRLEARLRRWTIPNLTGIIIGGQILLYLVETLRSAQGPPGDPFANLYLIPDKVLQGEVWRLVTFAFIPPPGGFLFVVISWMLFYFFGTALENQWGTVRYNLFLWLGVLANVAAAFLTLLHGPGYVASNGFLYGTVFLAFARLFPNFVINLFFILPIQIKWLALLAWIGYGYTLVKGDWMVRVLILASVANYLVFFGRDHWRDLKRGHRRRTFQSRTKEATRSLVHKCRVCGLDSDSSPKTLFRYCSKCAGQCCYCPEHIQNHEHVTADGETANEPQTADSGRA